MNRIIIIGLFILFLAAPAFASPAKQSKSTVIADFKGLALGMNLDDFKEYASTNQVGAVPAGDDIFEFHIPSLKWSRLGCQGSGDNEECFYINNGMINFKDDKIISIIFESALFSLDDFNLGLKNWCKFADYVITSKYGKPSIQANFDRINLLSINDNVALVSVWDRQKDKIVLIISQTNYNFSCRIFMLDKATLDKKEQDRQNKRPEF